MVTKVTLKRPPGLGAGANPMGEAFRDAIWDVIEDYLSAQAHTVDGGLGDVMSLLAIAPFAAILAAPLSKFAGKPNAQRELRLWSMSKQIDFAITAAATYIPEIPDAT